MIEFLFRVSGQIATQIDLLLAAGTLSMASISLVTLGGLIAGISPEGVAGALTAIGQFGPKDDSSTPNRDVVIASAFAFGMVLALTALGAVTAFSGHALLPPGVAKWLPLVTLLMGLNMLGLVSWNWLRLPLRIKASGATGAFLLGIPFGLAGSPCTLPILITVLAVTAAKGSVVLGSISLAAFAIGRSIPVVALGMFSDQLQSASAFRRIAPYIRKGAGALIVIASVYFLTLGRSLFV